MPFLQVSGQQRGAGSTIMYTDASIRSIVVATTIHFTTHPDLNKTSRFKVPEPPSPFCAELAVIPEALFAVTEIAFKPGAHVIFCTDALQAVRALQAVCMLRLVTGSSTLGKSVHHLTRRTDHEVQVE